MLAPETILQGRYRIVGQLGQGGMGAVYEAIDERLDTVVALKETLFAEERLRKQFEREARLLARLHHQALPRVSDHFTEGEGAFLVMQFIAGDDLQAMLAQRSGPFSATEVFKWADQLLDALDYLHTQDPQIIHRDIKPQNLKLTARGQIVLLDFGLAKGSAGQASVVTTSASIFGYTPNYAPLEQVQGLGTDGRSDLYALAATIYHLTTGVKPPDALSRAASIVNGQPDPLPPANEVALQINPAVAAVLAKAMAQNREQRYGSAAEMQQALRLAGGSGASVTGGENATILMSGIAGAAAHTLASEQPTALAGEAPTAIATEQQTRAAETITRVHAPGSRGNSAGWKVAIAAVVLLACAGIFYGYRVIRNRSQVNDPPTAAQPADPNAKPVAEGGQSTADESKKTTSNESSNQPAKETAQKNPPATTRKPNEPQQSDRVNTPAVPDAGVVGRTPNENVYREPADVPANTQTPSGPLGRGRRLPGGVTVRTLPDGTQVMTQPDGTRIIRRPNGGTRVFGRGEKPNRRRLP